MPDSKFQSLTAPRGGDPRSLPADVWIPAEAAFGWLAGGNPSQAAVVLNRVAGGEPVSAELEALELRRLEALELRRDCVVMKVRAGELPVFLEPSQGIELTLVSSFIFSEELWTATRWGSCSCGRLTIDALRGCIVYFWFGEPRLDALFEEARLKAGIDASDEAYARVKHAGVNGHLLFRRDDLIQAFCWGGLLAGMPQELQDRIQPQLGAQRDYEHDPANEAERDRMFELTSSQFELQTEIREVQLGPTTDVADRNKYLKKLNKKLARVEASILQLTKEPAGVLGSVVNQSDVRAEDTPQAAPLASVPSHAERPKATIPALTELLQGRVATWPDTEAAPPEQDDVRAAIDHFAPGLTRDEVRTIRRAATPPQWRTQGRRKPWGDVKPKVAE